MKVRYLVDLANVRAGEVVDQTKGAAERLIMRGLADAVPEEPISKKRPGRPRKVQPAEED